MMKRLILLAVAASWGAPAAATGGLVCRTAGPQPIEVSVGFGHVIGAPLIATRLLDNGRNVPVSAPQWWLDDREVRLLLSDPAAGRQELLLRARKNGSAYDGSLWRGGKRRWVRCREG